MQKINLWTHFLFTISGRLAVNFRLSRQNLKSVHVGRLFQAVFLYVIAEDLTCNVAFSYLVVTKILPSLDWMGIFFSSCTFRTRPGLGQSVT